MINKLIKCANHLDLLKYESNDNDKDKKLNFAKFCFDEDADEIGGYEQPKQFEKVTNDNLSGKLKVLGQLLRTWRLQPNSRILVFSHYTRILDIIEKYLDRQGMTNCRIDGSVTAAKRAQIVDDFNNLNKNNFVFLISTKAGGLGLNLTAANIVILFDSNWNPSCDSQAQDRAYRLGQQRNVDVYRLISTGTIEDKVYCRQLYKMQLSSDALEGNSEDRFFEGVQGLKSHQGELFGIKNLLEYDSDGHMLKLQRIVDTPKDIATSETLKAASLLANKSNNFTVQQALDKCL